MAQDYIRYDLHVQDALRGVVRRVLADVEKNGLPGDHHFYITFRTRHPGVRLSPRMLRDYPDEMTIVLQHQFWDLSVNEQVFEVGLSFKGIPEKLVVPFEALTGFFDRSVDFGLRFETEDNGLDEDDDADIDDSEDDGLSSPAPALLRPVPVQDDAPRRIFEVTAASDPVEQDVKAEAEESPAEQDDTAAEHDITGQDNADADHAAENDEEDGAEKPDAGARVVSLDAFRKKT